MSRTPATQLLEALSYLYGSLAVMDTGTLPPEYREVITILTRGWPLDLTDTEREEAAATAFATVAADVRLEGAYLYGTPRFVGHCIGLTRALTTEGRTHVLHDMIGLASTDGVLSMAEGAFLRALEKVWSTGLAIPNPGPIEPRISVAPPSSQPEWRDHSTAGAAVEPASSAFGATALPLPEPQVWWWEHLETISDATVEKGADATPESRTGQHRRLWDEMNAWVAELTAIALGDDHVKWANNPNQYQVGKLSYTYWARLAPQDDESFRDAFHVGLQLSKRLKWVDELAEPLGEYRSVPVLTLWASTNDRLIERLPEAQARLMMYGQRQLDLLLSNPELWSQGGALVRRPSTRGTKLRLEPAAAYLAARDQGTLPDASPDRISLFSPLITLDHVRTNPIGVSRLVADYIRLLAEPVVAARPASGVSPRDNPEPTTADAEQAKRELEAETRREIADMLTGRTPVYVSPALISAVQWGDLSKVQALLHGEDVDVDAVDPQEQMTALHYAAWDGHTEIVQALLEHGANPNPRDKDSFTPLNLAVNNCRTGCVQILLEHGATYDHRQRLTEPPGSVYHGSRGGTALRDAVLNQCWDIVDLLVAHGADLEVLLEPCAGAPEVPANFFDAVRQIAHEHPALSERFDNERLQQLMALCEQRTSTPTAQKPDTDGDAVADDDEELDDVDAILAALERGGDIDSSDDEDESDDEGDGEESEEKTGVSAINALALSPRGDELVAASADTRLNAWRVPSSQRTETNEPSGIFLLRESEWGWVDPVPEVEPEKLALAWHPEGDWIAYGANDGQVVLVENEGIWRLEGHSDWVRAVAFSPDGTWLVSGSDDGTARVWDFADRTERRALEHADWVRAVAVSPDGQRIATGCDDGHVRLWKAKDGALQATWEGHDGWVTSLAFSPDGKWLVSGGQDQTVRVWRVKDGALQHTLRAHTDSVRAVAVHPDGHTIASVGDDRVMRLWEAKTGRLQRNLMGSTGALNAVAFTPDGTQVVAGGADAVIRFWELASGRIVHTTGHLDLRHLQQASEDLMLPERFSGEAWLDGLKSAEGLNIPQGFCGLLQLNGLRSAEHLVLPGDLGGGLSLNGLKHAKDLTLPRQLGGDLRLRGLRTADGLTLPETIGGTLILPGTLQDQIEVPDGIEVVWADAIAEDPEHVRTGRSLPDEISAALAEASPWLTVEDLEEKRRGGDGLTAIPNYVLSAQATRAICARIRRDRIIPVWIPAEVYEHFEPFHKWNKVFWLIPWAVLQNGMNGPVCVEMQGLSIPKADDEFSLGIDIDRVAEVPSTTSRAYSFAPGAGDADPHWREWTLTFRDEGEVTLYEYQPDDDAGFHLDIAATIYDVRWPEIEEFRDSPIIVHNPDGVGAKQFDTLEDVVAWAFEGTGDAEDDQDESDDDA